MKALRHRELGWLFLETRLLEMKMWEMAIWRIWTTASGNLHPCCFCTSKDLLASRGGTSLDTSLWVSITCLSSLLLPPFLLWVPQPLTPTCFLGILHILVLVLGMPHHLSIRLSSQPLGPRDTFHVLITSTGWLSQLLATPLHLLFPACLPPKIGRLRLLCSFFHFTIQDHIWFSINTRGCWMHEWTSEWMNKCMNEEKQLLLRSSLHVVWGWTRPSPSEASPWCFCDCCNKYFSVSLVAARKRLWI